MQPTDTQIPTNDELVKFSIKSFRGIEVGLGQADPGVILAQKLEQQYPGHLILIQAGKFLHAYDKSAHTLNTLKQYKLKLVGTSDDPHIRVGFPAGSFKRRLWSMVDEFQTPYAVSLGSKATGYTVYVSEQQAVNSSLLSAVSDQVVQEVINDLRQRGEVNQAGANMMPAVMTVRKRLHLTRRCSATPDQHSHKDLHECD